jgi:DNA-directed RNA polymerase specialized sigma24 family protein
MKSRVQTEDQQLGEPSLPQGMMPSAEEFGTMLADAGEGSLLAVGKLDAFVARLHQEVASGKWSQLQVLLSLAKPPEHQASVRSDKIAQKAFVVLKTLLPVICRQMIAAAKAGASECLQATTELARSGDTEAVEALRQRVADLESLALQKHQDAAQTLSLLAAKPIYDSSAMSAVLRIVQNAEAVQDAFAKHCNIEADILLQRHAMANGINVGKHGDAQCFLDDVKQQFFMKRYPRMLVDTTTPEAFWSRLRSELPQMFKDELRKNLAEKRGGKHEHISADSPAWTTGEAEGTEKVLDGMADNQPSPATEAGSNDRRRIMRVAISRLGPPCAPLLFLKFFADCTIEELCASLDVPQGSIGGKTKECLKALITKMPAKDLASLRGFYGKSTNPPAP